MNKFLLLLLLFSSSLFGQVGGETIYNFLNIATSAQQASLGGKALTLVNDANQPNWNPSLINERIQNKISINYINYLADISMGTISFTPKISDKIGVLYTGISYLNYGDFIKANDQGDEEGSFKAYDLSFSIGYAYNIPNSNIYVGANVKLINSAIDNYSSVGIGSDLAVSYLKDTNPFMASIVLRNIGSQITVYDDDKEDLPTEVMIGASYKLQNVPITWHFTIDHLEQWDVSVSNPSNLITDLEGNETQENISFFNNAIRHVSIGAELFPENGFNLRFGYNFRRSKELQLIDKRSFAGFTAGFGLKLNKFKLNYGFSKYHPASNVNTFSLQINLD